MLPVEGGLKAFESELEHVKFGPANVLSATYYSEFQQKCSVGEYSTRVLQCAIGIWLARHDAYKHHRAYFWAKIQSSESGTDRETKNEPIALYLAAFTLCKGVRENECNVVMMVDVDSTENGKHAECKGYHAS